MRTRPSLGFFLLTLVVAGCVEFNPSVVDPEPFLGKMTRPSGMYTEAGTAALLSPFDVAFTPMDALMLFPFEDDPLFREVELQLMRHGEEVAPRVILYRKHGGADVYVRPQAPAWVRDARDVEVVNQERFLETDISYELAVLPTGLRARLALRTAEGQLLSFEVVEKGERRIRTGVIAPIGAEAVAPTAFPLFYIHDLALTPRSGTELAIQVGGNARSPTTLTRLVKGPASYLVRYSNHVSIARWNGRGTATLLPLSLSGGATVVRDGDLEYKLSWDQLHPEIAEMIAHHGPDTLRFRFSPPIPDLPAIKDGLTIEGRFTVDANADAGVLAGEYSVERRGRGVRIHVHPTKVFQPPTIAGGLWVASYEWQAQLTPGPGREVRLQAAWARRQQQ